MRRPRPEEPGPLVSVRHPETARAMETRALPRLGTYRREVYDVVVRRGDHGATDDEIEVVTGRPHQSASAAMSTLRRDGWLRDSGRDRNTRYGNPATVWTAVVR